MHNELTHIDHLGKANMVNVSHKEPMLRTAVAQALFVAKESTIDCLLQGNLPKGEALAVARIAGIQAAKKCGSLIPLCHPLPIEHVEVKFKRIGKNTISIQSSAVVTGKTGIEMECLTAASVAALTLWDMTKAIDSNLSIENIKLVEKLKTPLNEDS